MNLKARPQLLVLPLPLVFALWSVWLTAGLGKAGAQSIGVNLVGGTGAAGTLAATDEAGGPGVVQANWNNAIGASGAFSNLVDNAGQPTTLSISWSDACGTSDNLTVGPTS